MIESFVTRMMISLAEMRAQEEKRKQSLLRAEFDRKALNSRMLVEMEIARERNEYH